MPTSENATKDCLLMFVRAIIFIILLWQPLFTYSFSLYGDTTKIQTRENLLSYGAGKFMNIYNFNLLFDYQSENSLGIFDLNQKYYGNASMEGRKIFQNDQNLQFAYFTPAYNDFRLLFSNSYQLTSNPGSFELNELKRLNGLLGLNYDIDRTNYLRLSYGLEDNSQVGVSSSGNIIQFEGKYSSNNSGADFTSKINGELLSLNYDRNFNTVSLFSGYSKNFSGYDIIRVDAGITYLERANLLRRDSTYLSLNDLVFPFSIEDRGSMAYFTDLGMNYQINKVLFGGFKFHYARNTVDKLFKGYVPNDINTAVTRSRDITTIRISGLVEYITTNFINTLTLNYSSENDENKVLRTRSIDNDRFNQMRTEAFQLDNITAITFLTNRSVIRLSQKDTIKSNLMVMITRYDTPSELNYSDRDEFMTIVSASYLREVNTLFSAGINAELQMNHLVYLKSQRSASNYWMRILKLSPFFSYTSKILTFKPTFNILANYTVYDFESITAGISSFSFRQIGYSDSISVFLTSKTKLLLNYDLNYRETGILFWTTFEESPVSSNFKFFSKGFISYSENENLDVAVGFRYYNLSNKNISVNITRRNDFINVSMGPEININVKFNDYSLISFSGWYEFRYINNRLSGEIPNLYLISQLKL